jgi:hypothetical protein
VGLFFAMSAEAQEIGANFNHNPEIIDFEYLKNTPVEWVRTTPYIFEYMHGERNPETDVGLIKAKELGYKVAFGFRWDFRRYNLPIPAPNSADEKKYFDMATMIMERVGGCIDIFKLGNEPNLETLEADLMLSKEGIVPIVRFTERLLTQVIELFYASHTGFRRPDMYTGSLPRLFLPEDQNKPGVSGLIRLAQENPAIKGLAIHLHIADSNEMDKALAFVRSIMPTKSIIVPEYSLFRLYNRHTRDSLSSSEAGQAFAKKYSYSPSMKLYEWYGIANSQKVSPEEWKDLFDSRSWFPRSFMRTYYRYFKKYGVVLATYGYMSQSVPMEASPTIPTWFINPIFPNKSIRENSDGTFPGNPLWYDDFVWAIQEGKRGKINQ